MLYEVLQKAKIEAMKEKNEEKKMAISTVIEAAKKIAIDKELDRANIPDDVTVSCLMKELKTLDEQLASCPADREDLKKKFEERKSYIQEFAPKMLSKDEILSIINEKFQEIVATKNKGQIMKAIMPELKGKADGKLINEIIEGLCQ